MRLNVPGHGCYCPVQVNGIYISTENVNPSTYWPGTSWSLYGQDRFLLGAGSSYNGGATGGEATHVLTLAEAPSHRHLQGQDKYGTSVPGNQSGVALATGSISGNALYTNYQGGGQPHNNMPPYIAAYFWKRTE